MIFSESKVCKFYLQIFLTLVAIFNTSHLLATTMQVKEFEWRPSVVLVGQLTSFHWNIENAKSCFGNNKSRTPSGNNGQHAYSSAQFKLTSWTCTDNQGRTIDLSATLTVEERPNKPTNPHAAAANNSINVSWGGASGAASYYIYYKSNSNNWALLANTSQTNLSTGLFEPGTYSFKIQSCTVNSNCSDFSSVTSASISPPPMLVRQFEWQPSIVEVGELTSFHWDIENAVSCFGNNKQRAASGDNGKHFYTDPESKTTQWYCNDKYGNRLPENPNEFLTAGLEVIPKPMVVRQFEWQPSIVEVGELTSFHWDIENAVSCFGNNKQRTASGNNGKHFYTDPESKTTQWYCNDKYGNRLPENPNEYLTASLEVKPKPITVRRFEWQPAVIEAGQEAIFNWDVENATSCFGEHKAHQPIGSSDRQQFIQEQTVITKWYCNDTYGNRFPVAEGEFITAKLEVVQSNKANLPACFDVPENTAPNQPIKISWCNTAKQDVKKFEVYGELKGLLFEGSPTNIVKNTFGQFEINRPTLPEGREYCYKVIAHFNDGSMGQFTETKCTQVGAKLFEEPTSFIITAQNNSYIFEWSDVAGAHHYLLEQRITAQPATWQIFDCSNRLANTSQCQANLQATDFLSELDNTAIFRVAACTSENKCGDYRRARVLKPVAMLFISGFPNQTVKIGQSYQFTPQVENKTSASVIFSATGLPSWLKLDSQTGRLAGIPSESDFGTSSKIILTASTGNESVSLPEFDVVVVKVSSLTATITSPLPDMQLTVGRFNVEATSSDNSRTQQLLFQLNQGPWVADSDGQAPWVMSFNEEPQGEYRVSVKLVDLTGAESFEEEVFVELVLGVPEIVIDYNKEQASYVINWQPIIGASSYKIEEKLGDAAWQAVATQSESQVSFDRQPAGIYKYRVKACDSAGQCSLTSTVKSVAVDMESGFCLAR